MFAKKIVIIGLWGINTSPYTEDKVFFVQIWLNKEYSIDKRQRMHTENSLLQHKKKVIAWKNLVLHTKSPTPPLFSISDAL